MITRVLLTLTISWTDIDTQPLKSSILIIGLAMTVEFSLSTEEYTQQTFAINMLEILSVHYRAKTS